MTAPLDPVLWEPSLSDEHERVDDGPGDELGPVLRLVGDTMPLVLVMVELDDSDTGAPPRGAACVLRRNHAWNCSYPESRERTVAFHHIVEKPKNYLNPLTVSPS